jgi:hypothetical protein
MCSLIAARRMKRRKHEKEISSSTDGSSYGYDSSDRLWQQGR